MAEIKEFKKGNNINFKFLTLPIDFNKLNEDLLAAWRRVMGGKNNLAFEIYISLLKSKKGEFTETISTKLNEPIHNVRRSLNDLRIIGLVEKIRRKKDRVLSDFWRIKEKIEGLLRLIPTDKTKSRLPGEEKFWVDKYQELSKLFINYTGYNWILNKNISWKIEKDGLMDYNEERKYLKLSDTVPPVNYITLFAKSDNYNLKILDQNGDPFEILTEIYEHQNKKLNIVNALIPQDNFLLDFRKLHIGEFYPVKIEDRKRLYACPKTAKIYMACFLYQINLENIDSLELNYQIHENLHPISCGIWFDNHKELEINLTSPHSQEQDSISWEVKSLKKYVDFHWQGKILLKKAHILKFLLQLEPEYESDTKKWIKMYQAIACPFCHKIPFETIGRI